AAGVDRMLCRLNQLFLFKTAQQAAHQPGIEAEIFAYFRHVPQSMSACDQNAGRAKRAATTEKRGIERADLRRDGTVKSADARHGIVHISDFSQIKSHVTQPGDR